METKETDKDRKMNERREMQWEMEGKTQSNGEMSRGRENQKGKRVCAMPRM